MKLEQLLETVYLDGFDSSELESRVASYILDNDPDVENYQGQFIQSGDVVFRKGGQFPPREKNTIVWGSRYYGKNQQYHLLKNVVPTAKTFLDAGNLSAGDGFVAKPDHGQRQQGLLIDEMPEDSSGYIFQPKLNIHSEYRVITYYMNGKYHVSGVYKKSGHNVSARTLPKNSTIAQSIASVGAVATEALGYGLGGADIALVPLEDKHKLEESFLSKSTSRLMKAAGFADSWFSGNTINSMIPVLIEVNTKPSMANPAILGDLLDSARSMAI